MLLNRYCQLWDLAELQICVFLLCHRSRGDASAVGMSGFYVCPFYCRQIAILASS